MSFKIASHDSMTYLKPLKWWMRPFKFVAQCQSVDLESQYNDYGIRMFDIRIRWNKDHWCFSHGCMMFDADVIKTLDWLNKQGKIMIRLLLEYNREPKDSKEIIQKFVEFCDMARERYKNLTFFEFRAKWNWDKLYTYKEEPRPSIYQATSSTTWRILDDWWPWLYAKSHNKDNRKQGTTAEWLLLDFINI